VTATSTNSQRYFGKDILNQVSNVAAAGTNSSSTIASSIEMKNTKQR
jgi:hypothetical protein